MNAVAELPFSTHELVLANAGAPRVSTWQQMMLSVSRFAPTTLIARYLARQLDTLAQSASGKALVLRGIADQIRERECMEGYIDADDALRALLDGLEADLVSLAALKISLPPGGVNDEVNNAARRFEQSANAAVAEVRDLKGVIQAHDANVEALQRVLRTPATTAGELAHCLDELFRP